MAKVLKIPKKSFFCVFLSCGMKFFLTFADRINKIENHNISNIMKKLFLLSLFAIFAMGAANAQDVKAAPANGPKIIFSTLEHNYGTINKGGDGNCVFEFVNEGNEPLILSNVKASCGCTTPSWTKEPVMPGQRGQIKVRYNTNNVGGFTKTITVTSNAVDNPRVVLKIKGTVKNPDENK